MLAKEITVGGVYVAKVSSKLTRVRVDRIVEKMLWRRGERSAWGWHYLCTNLATGRPVVVKSCQRFRSAVPS